jgi:hypothetical protein
MPMVVACYLPFWFRNLGGCNLIGGDWGGCEFGGEDLDISFREHSFPQRYRYKK